jgi:hypothetical protein
LFGRSSPHRRSSQRIPSGRTAWSSTRSATSDFEPEAANLFFQLVSAHYERASLIVTSNIPFGKAHLFA